MPAGAGRISAGVDTFSDGFEGQGVVAGGAACGRVHLSSSAGADRDPKWLERAIHGGYQVRSTGDNRVWGWLKISQVAARAAKSDQKYRDMFFEVRLNIARRRYLAA